MKIESANVQTSRGDAVPTVLETRCCIAGGGPAGMMLGFLLARAGVDVVVMEKHADFLRDFRGDTIHPSTLELMYELGILDEFLERPHQKMTRPSAQIDDLPISGGDFSHLPTKCKFVAFMPQWEFLNFIAEKAVRYPAFHLMMQAEVTDLLENDGRVCGVRAETSTGTLEVRAPLTVGADGRHSVVRASAKLEVIDRGAPLDVLWMRLSRHPGESLGRVRAGRILITLNRGDYWQCAYAIRKGAFLDLQRQGIQEFRAGLATVAPFLHDRVSELKSWDDVKLLTVRVDRLKRWHLPGLLCIGDAAHAMSPVGGVGINLAVQDAVAAANRLANPLLQGRVARVICELCNAEENFQRASRRRFRYLRTIDSSNRR